MKPGNKQKITKLGKKRFDKWNADKYPVFNSEGEKLILKDDEYFTMLCDYYGKRGGTNPRTLLNPRYYISNYGNILAFTELEKDMPEWLLRKGNQGKITDYEKCGGWYVHVAIYLSFIMATEDQRDYLSKQKINVQNFNGRNQVHHIDKDHWHNHLDNLQGLTKKVHSALTMVGKKHTGERKFKTEEKYVETVISMISTNDFDIEPGNSIVIPDSKETAVIQTETSFEGYAEEQNLLMEYGQDAHEKLKEVIKQIGIDSFSEEQIVMIKYEGERIPLTFKVIKNDDTSVQIKFVSRKEVEEKEVYEYYCEGTKNRINKKMYVKMSDGSNVFAIQRG